MHDEFMRVSVMSVELFNNERNMPFETVNDQRKKFVIGNSTKKDADI